MFKKKNATAPNDHALAPEIPRMQCDVSNLSTFLAVYYCVVLTVRD